jgi:CRISPR-associated protein Cas1
MKRNYYIFKSGRIRRQDNTIYLETEEEKKPIPIEDIESLYLFGEVDLNTKLLNFLAQKTIPIHFFNYYGFYSGSFYPRDYLVSGFLLLKQVEHYQDQKKRLFLAKEFIKSAASNILKNVKYYSNRKEDLGEWEADVSDKLAELEKPEDIPSLMASEGRLRNAYYKGFNSILNIDFEFEKRVRRPPDNMVNALISFGNGLLYATVLSEIYRTQLNPLISFLHEPGERRFSLSLDLSEIFKPIIVDHLIFRMINGKMLDEGDFDEDVNYCYLKEKGRKAFLKEYDEKLNTTIMHRTLKRKVSYRHLIRLECYKLVKHLSGVEEFKGFRAWW